MSEITSFDSVEEMMGAIDEARKSADAQVKPHQAALKIGDHFLQITEMGFWIWGEVLECYEEDRMKHYRFCNCFSNVCPHGEMGDVHVSVVTGTISKEAFDGIVKRLQGVKEE
ncbi:hypothetical protein ACFL6S_04145 [Candidatus Poribacteria bacterium]